MKAHEKQKTMLPSPTSSPSPSNKKDSLNYQCNMPPKIDTTSIHLADDIILEALSMPPHSLPLHLKRMTYWTSFTWLWEEYPGVPVYWKSLSVIRANNVKDLSGLSADAANLIETGTQYNSASRMQVLQEAFEDLLQEENFQGKITTWDVYQGMQLAARWLFLVDNHNF